MSDITSMNEAVLLIGPSGVGKTPLGDLLERDGLGGRACVHMDFGAELRRLVAEGVASDRVTAEELEFLREVLEAGALLEADRMSLGLRIVKGFLARRQADRSTLVVLNGFPRHPAQAVAVEEVVGVVGVVRLACDEQTILRRIETDPGGDRQGREDDEPEKVVARFRLFLQRTAPLVEHYRSRGVRVETVDVSEGAGPEELGQALAELW